MLFENLQNSFYNVPDNLIVHKSFYPSYSKASCLLIDGHTSPDGANALDQSKIMSLKKSFSELLERRNLLLGGYGNQDKLVPSWNLVTDAVELLPYSSTVYQATGENPSDTTGTATHKNSSAAIEIAVMEILEKNALFLFWYGKIGKRIHVDESIIALEIFQHLKEQNNSIDLYCNMSFNSLFVVFVVLKKTNSIIYTGIGTSYCISKAIKKALEETYLLKWHKESNNIIAEDYFNTIVEPGNISIKNDYLSEFEKLPFLGPEVFKEYKKPDPKSFFPEWLSDLHIIFLRNSIYPSLKCIKVFSSELYNHVPLKKYIILKRKVNLQTINIDEKSFNVIPECIFI
ncbi:YcaO-like family protein [Sporosarcina limicola]|uniref:YcaO domain-containing protein n=1 Tax=Sporosarcina limicola TaxID=34101 RepID=A0A927R4V8_9BACL|nr:YcaO-like family protein [Sporosarcina limicola]MBE1553289.1 hypothetical protein [Sporosarcina limicola]